MLVGLREGEVGLALAKGPVETNNLQPTGGGEVVFIGSLLLTTGRSTPCARPPPEPPPSSGTETDRNHGVVLSLSTTASPYPAHSTWHAPGARCEREEDADTVDSYTREDNSVTPFASAPLASNISSRVPVGSQPYNTQRLTDATDTGSAAVSSEPSSNQNLTVPGLHGMTPAAPYVDSTQLALSVSSDGPATAGHLAAPKVDGANAGVVAQYDGPALTVDRRVSEDTGFYPPQTVDPRGGTDSDNAPLASNISSRVPVGSQPDNTQHLTDVTDTGSAAVSSEPSNQNLTVPGLHGMTPAAPYVDSTQLALSVSSDGPATAGHLAAPKVDGANAGVVAQYDRPALMVDRRAPEDTGFYPPQTVDPRGGTDSDHNQHGIRGVVPTLAPDRTVYEHPSDHILTRSGAEPTTGTLESPQGGLDPAHNSTSDPTMTFHVDSAREMLEALGWSGSGEKVHEVASDIFHDYMLNFGTEAAQAWGQNFWSGLEPDAIETAARLDSVDFAESGWDLERLVHSRQDRQAHNRLSPERVDAVSAQVMETRTGLHHTLDNVDWELMEHDLETLRIFGRDGVPILTVPDFHPSTRDTTTPTKWARNYIAAPAAVDALIFKAWQAGCGIFLTDEAAQKVVGRHEMRSSWAPKKGKPSGRLTLDASTNASLLPPYLNTEEAKEMCREIFGDILDQPDIDIICQLLIRMADRYGRAFVVLWKTDLKAAFNLLKFRAAMARLMSTRLMRGIVFIYTQGNFGWTGMPFAFQVVVRVLLVLITAVIKGLVDMFVDDLIGVSHKDSWIADRDAAITVMRALLGDDSEEPDKRESTEGTDNPDRRITALGWEFCLSEWTVDAARRNRFKALYTFWAFDIDGPVRMDKWEAMCSMAQRYARVYRELGVLMGDLYSARPVFRTRRQAHALPLRTRTAVMMWRAYLIRTELRLREDLPTGRSIDSFRRRSYNIVVEFDGCPKGIGFRLFCVQDSHETLVGEWGATAMYDLHNDSQYQNAMEVNAATCGLLQATSLWGPGIAVHFRGDSETALKWLANDMSSFQSHRARGAAMLLVVIREDYGVYIDTNTSWIRGDTDNIRADALSRGMHLDPIPGVLLSCAAEGSTIMESLEWCNPLMRLETAQAICQRWRNLRTWCHTTLGPPSGPDFVQEVLAPNPSSPSPTHTI